MWTTGRGATSVLMKLLACSLYLRYLMIDILQVYHMHCCSLRLVFLNKDSKSQLLYHFYPINPHPCGFQCRRPFALHIPAARTLHFECGDDPLLFLVLMFSSPFLAVFYPPPPFLGRCFIFPHLFCRMFYLAAPFFGNVFFPPFFAPGFINHCRRETTRALGSSTRLGPDVTMWRCSTWIN